MDSQTHIRITEQYSAHNYAPIEVVLSSGQGAWVTDVDGHRYLDCLTAYSAVSFGHSNPRLVAAAKRQLDKATLTSRAFYNDQLGLFCEELAALCGMETVLPMNSGAEAVETAIKLSRRWGYEIKGIEPEKAEIVCFEQNFHGRTTTIISFSSSATSRSGFGPFTPGFRNVPFGDSEELARAINKHTAAVLLEPMQGEAGVVVPPDNFVREVRRLCSENNVLLVADEIQTGLCRTGKLFACDHEEVKPDVFLLGKALGGGIVPLSAVVTRWDVMNVLTPGSHGSTFGGNPLACAIGREVISLIKEEHPEANASRMGKYLLDGIQKLVGDKLIRARGRGLLIGLDIAEKQGKARLFAEKLIKEGLLTKDTHEHTLRLAPALFLSQDEADYALERLGRVFR